MDVSPKLKKFIFDKIDSDLSEVIFHPYGKELWLFTLEDKCWYFVGDSDGTVWFNQKFFDNFFRIFSLNTKQYTPLLKLWFETKTTIFARKISRRNTNYDYMIDGVIKRSQKDYDWTLKKRWGFSFPIVKKYVDLKESSKTNILKLKDF